jgi:hypothetical protein
MKKLLLLMVVAIRYPTSSEWACLWVWVFRTMARGAALKVVSGMDIIVPLPQKKKRLSMNGV